MATAFLSLSIDAIRDLIEEHRIALMTVGTPYIHLGEGDIVHLWANEDLDDERMSQENARGACLAVLEARRVDLHDVGSLKLEGLDEEATVQTLFGVTLDGLPAFWDAGDRSEGTRWADNPRIEVLLLDTHNPTLSDRMYSVDGPPPASTEEEATEEGA